MPSNVMLLLTVICTLVILAVFENVRIMGIKNKILILGGSIGKRSYSIYIWHQLVVAFMFYSFFEKHTMVSMFFYLIIVSVVSFFSYKYIERPLAQIFSKKRESEVVLSTGLTACLLCLLSFFIYRCEGVVRDVYELGISQNNIPKKLYMSYINRPYEWDHDFNEPNKAKVLVLGNSFGRDCANLLQEYNVDDLFQISYIYIENSKSFKQSMTGKMNRIDEADYVFFAVDPHEGFVPDFVKKNIPKEKLYVIGNKKWGNTMGLVYARRFSEKYFTQTVEVGDKIIQDNSALLSEFGDHFIDLMEPVMVDGKRAKVFTDDNKFISPDCIHLSKAGALYYAKVLNVDEILSKRSP